MNVHSERRGVSLDELADRVGVRRVVLEEILRDELRRGRVRVDKSGRFEIVLAGFTAEQVEGLRGLAPSEPDESTFVPRTDVGSRGWRWPRPEQGMRTAERAALARPLSNGQPATAARVADGEAAG